MPTIVDYSFIFIIFQIIAPLLRSSPKDMLYSKPFNEILVAHEFPLNFAFTLIELDPRHKLELIRNLPKEILLIFLIIFVLHRGIKLLYRPFDNAFVIFTTCKETTPKLMRI